MRKLSARVALLLPLLSLPVASCASEVTTSSEPNDFDHDVVISMSLTVAPGEELHQCQLVMLPTDSEIQVVAFSHKYTAGSHHFLVFATDLDTIPPHLAGRYDCVNGDEPIMEHAQGILYGAQSAEATFPLPSGVGFKMKAHQVVMLQAHYLNPTASAIAAKIQAGFDTAPAASIRQQAGFMIFYDPFIYIPAQSTATAGIRCSVPSDVNVIAAFTHYHQRGTAMRVWVDPSMSQESAEPFHETHDWEHPADFKGPLAVPAGSALRFECAYTNGDSVDVFQGPNAATSEMCVFAGLYYPQAPRDFDNCADLSITGHGDKTCSSVLSCVQNCPGDDAPRFTNGGVLVGPCWERCVASGCQGAVDKVLPVSFCVGDKCAAECAMGADACEACATTQCAAEVGVCLAHQCGR
ncbi:MAG TPA: hypothetical protein VK550_32130 [Polyangiaceae bacterium]|nr:hypothetical protein [Polyangiaceae bacterium]